LFYSLWLLAAQTWCIDKGFELVELNPVPEEEDESDLEDDFPESTGIKRVIQALHAHMWPNLILKGNSKRNPNDCIIKPSKM